MSTQSPTLELSHLQFDAIPRGRTRLSEAARLRAVLVCLLGLLGLRVFEATSLNISDLGEQHGNRVVRVVGNETKIALVPMPPAIARPVDGSIANARSDPSCSTAMASEWTGHPPPSPTTKSSGVAIARMHPRMSIRSTGMVRSGPYGLVFIALCAPTRSA